MVIPFVNKIERGKDWIAGISVTDANWNGNYVEITFSLKFSYEVAKHLIHLPGQQGFSIPIDSNKWSQVSEIDSKFQNMFITIFPKLNAIQLCLTYLWIHKKKKEFKRLSFICFLLDSLSCLLPHLYPKKYWYIY